MRYAKFLGILILLICVTACTDHNSKIALENVNSIMYKGMKIDKKEYIEIIKIIDQEKIISKKSLEKKEKYIIVRKDLIIKTKAETIEYTVEPTYIYRKDTKKGSHTTNMYTYLEEMYKKNQ